MVQDFKSYEGMRSAIDMLKIISNSEKDIKKGNLRSDKDVFKDIEASVEEKLR